MPIRIGPFDSPDRHPNRMVETTTSCRLTPSCAGSPSVATTHPWVRASRRRSDRGGGRSLPRSAPNQSERSEWLRSPSGRRSSRPDGKASVPNGRASPGMERRQPSPKRVERTLEPTPAFQTRGDREGRQTTRNQGVSPAGRTQPRIQARGHLRPLRQDPDVVGTSENFRLANCSEPARSGTANTLEGIFATTCCGGNWKSTTFRHPFDDSVEQSQKENTEADRIFQHTIWVWTDVRQAPTYHQLWIDGRNLLIRPVPTGRTRTEPVHSTGCLFSTPMI